jgi:hypothetical protein
MKSRFAMLSINSLIGLMLVLILPSNSNSVSAQTEASGEDQYMVTNAAAAANGATITASSTYNTNYPASGVINGDRKGIGWGAGTGGWNDATASQYPDSVEIQFASLMSIGEIDIVTLQDNYTSPTEPTLDMTFSLYGIRDFRVSYRGSDGLWYLLWTVTGNNKVLRNFKFTPVLTDRIKVEVLNSNQFYSRLVEVEAWGDSGIQLITEPVESAPSSTPSLCKNNTMDPCELSRNLLSAMQGNKTGQLPYGNYSNLVGTPYYRSQNWTSQLQWTFNNWRNYGSQNKPPLAHALTLWRTPGEYGKTTDTEALNWWISYFDCQTVPTGCTVSNPVTLQYWKSAELFSNTYDAETVSAIIATHVWAAREYASIPDSTRRTTVKSVLDKARAYLQMNWRLYALAAGKGPASKQLNRFNYSDDPANPFNDTSHQGCQNNYNGPFIPIAGMRSTLEHTCGTDDRGPMLARALNWIHNGPHGTDHMKELLAQAETIKSAANQMTGALYTTESAYALASGVRSMLKRHIDGTPNSGEDTVATILGGLQNVRTGVDYYFVGARVNGLAGNEVRITLMRDNLTSETAPMFAITYDYTQRIARMLFPWTNRAVSPGCQSATPYPSKPWRGMVTKGYADFLPSENSPTAVFGSSKNRDGSSDCKNYENGASVTEQFSLPASWQWYYYIKFSSSAPPLRLR